MNKIITIAAIFATTLSVTACGNSDIDKVKALMCNAPIMPSHGGDMARFQEELKKYQEEMKKMNMELIDATKDHQNDPDFQAEYAKLMLDPQCDK